MREEVRSGPVEKSRPQEIPGREKEKDRIDGDRYGQGIWFPFGKGAFR